MNHAKDKPVTEERGNGTGMHHCFICFADVLLPELIKLLQTGLKELEMIRDIGGYLLCQYELLPVELLRHSFFHLLIGAIAHIDYKGGKTEKGAHSKNNKSTRSDISDFAQDALLMLANKTCNISINQDGIKRLIYYITISDIVNNTHGFPFPNALHAIPAISHPFPKGIGCSNSHLPKNDKYFRQDYRIDLIL